MDFVCKGLFGKLLSPLSFFDPVLAIIEVFNNMDLATFFNIVLFLFVSIFRGTI